MEFNLVVARFAEVVIPGSGIDIFQRRGGAAFAGGVAQQVLQSQCGDREQIVSMLRAVGQLDWDLGAVKCGDGVLVLGLRYALLLGAVLDRKSTRLNSSH